MGRVPEPRVRGARPLGQREEPAAGFSRRMGRIGSGPARPMSWTPSASGSERHWTGPSPRSGTAKSLRPGGMSLGTSAGMGMGTQTTRTSGTGTRAGTETGGTGCESHGL